MSHIRNPWQILAKQKIYDNPWIDVIHYDVLNPAGNKGIYGKVHFKNVAIGVIALDNEYNTFLVGQYRFVLNAYSWEIPEGGCPEGEDYLNAAKRELLEETGLIAAKWIELARAHLSNSVSDELSVIFLATDLEQSIPSPEETEQLTVKKLPFNEAVEMVNSGAITDSVTVIAIQKIQLMQLLNQA